MHNIISINELWEIYNLSSNLICIVNSSGCFEHVNPPFLNILGYTEEDLLGRPFNSFVHPDDVPSNLGIEANMIFDLPVHSFTNRMYTYDGDYKCFSWTVTAPNATGKIYAFAQDCTAKMLLEEEMKKLSQIAKKTPHGITITGLDRKAIWVNEAFTNITGYTMKDVIGKNPWQLLSGPLTSVNANALIKTKIKQGLPFCKEFINYKKNGEVFWMRLEAQPLYDHKGKIEKWFQIQTDITHYKMAEQAIVNSEKKYRSIFDNSPLPNIMYNKDTLKIIEVNKAAIQHYGYDLGTFLTLTIEDLEAEEERIDHHEIGTILSRIHFYNGNATHFKKSRQMIKVETTYSTIDYKNSSAVLVIIKDVTELHLQRKKIMHQYNCLRDIAWKQSHIMRSPLANLKGLLPIMKAEPLNPKYFEHMESELEKLDRVIIEMVKEATADISIQHT